MISDSYSPQQSRHVIDHFPGEENTRLGERRNNAVARALTPLLPIYADVADGGIIADKDGNRFIDFASGIAVTTVGARNPKVIAAAKEALDHFTHTNFSITPYESYVAVCEKLNEITPGNHEKRSVLLNSGAEAVENAVKIARHYTRRPSVVVFDYAYHGRTNLTMTMTAKNIPYRNGFGPLASNVFRTPMSYPLRDNLSGQEAATKAITMIDAGVGPENIACVVVEPIQGEGGFIEPAQGFLTAINQWCQDNGIVFIADEIQAGLCRTGHWFACDYEDVVPDLVTTAKGLAGGMPLSAVTGRAEIMDSPIPSGLGGTYTGNPVACAAALAALDQMAELDLCSAAQRIDNIITEELSPLLELDHVAELRGRGAMKALEFVHPDGAPDPERTAKIAAAVRDRGVLALVCGFYGNVIRMLPPLVIEEELLRDGLQVIVEEARK
ncbi:4-aminobutyrate--2-oxoglutarate transaminase [Corynebacterium poyangense]|uniref:(S)-3-amino-2-methylpropionate transaminase n=1 Tax=Corynebacterium poyangense TaxID=2684405 RepID=A0A7H0SL46_9CORY|nr:4-aminobutyrate--2-oxoglutarate transaminase [Corynebacterium poyangense]MBZ8177356.1 4-aminobutyrate--2-oxoglutarate transaminase [Corynebacterium poyangense]QNQ89271.1 4-aminobutyrate--2-oxoglutarate transaminase [Corynebacterium poyangense]